MMETGQVNEDHNCSICLSVFYKPIKLKKCGHIFCRLCIEQATQLADNKVCPLCRKPFRSLEMQDLKELEKQMNGLYPNQLKQKIANIKQKRVYRLEIGNTTQEMDNKNINKYLWTLFIQPAPGQKQLQEFVQNIEIQLHPTFSPSKITFDPKKPVTLKRWGWGTFRIDIKVNWKKQFGGHTDLYHDLDFIPRASKIVTCKIDAK